MVIYNDSEKYSFEHGDNEFDVMSLPASLVLLDEYNEQAISFRFRVEDDVIQVRAINAQDSVYHTDWIAVTAVADLGLDLNDQAKLRNLGKSN